MKVCMIGDSHLTMILEANKARHSSDIDISAVTWPRQFEDQFSFQGAELYATGSELKEFWGSCGLTGTVDLTQFDIVVFVSHTVTMFNVFNILRDHVVASWNGAHPAIKSINSYPSTPNKRRLLTLQAFQECLVGIIRSNYAFRITSQLREQSLVPAFVLPPPFLAEKTLTHRPNLTGLKRILNHDDGYVFAASYNAAHRAAFDHFTGVTVVAQPEQSLTNGCLTREAYRKGAKRFGTDRAHNDDDVIHAGPLLGELLLNSIFEQAALT